MKFKCSGLTGTRYLEQTRKKSVDKIEINISGIVYQINEEVDIKNGNYLADVNVVYTDGLVEVIKKQPLKIDGSNIKVRLDMMKPIYRVTNLLLNYKFYITSIIAGILIVLLGEIGGLALVFAILIASNGSDYYYKRDGFDKTFRAVFK